MRLEERMIRQALDQCRWQKGRAAHALGLNLRTLQRKMKRLGMSGPRTGTLMLEGGPPRKEQ